MNQELTLFLKGKTVGGGGGGCEPRIEVILEMQKKESRGSVGCDYSRAGEWVRWVDLIKELK